MHADFFVELGRNDAALELPWSSANPAVRYYDLKKHPELLREIPEVAACPELGAFLARINAAGFPLATAKCDMWQSREVAPEEEIFGDRKFVSYVDLVFEDETQRYSFEKHEAFAKTLCRLLGQAPEIPAAVEVVIRRCYYHGESGVAEAEASEAEAAGEVVEVTAAESATDEGGAGDVHRTEAKSEVETGDASDAETKGAGERRHSGEAKEAAVARDTTEAEDVADGKNTAEARDDDKQQSGKTNRENADRVGASVRTRQQADIGERSEAGIEEEGTAGRLDERAEGACMVLNDPEGAVSGFCLTAYVSGFGDSDHEPRLRWQIALALLQNALVQLARDESVK